MYVMDLMTDDNPEIPANWNYAREYSRRYQASRLVRASDEASRTHRHRQPDALSIQPDSTSWSKRSGQRPRRYTFSNVIIDPAAPGDIAPEVIARSKDGDRQFTPEPGETKYALCERAARAIGLAPVIERLT